MLRRILIVILPLAAAPALASDVVREFSGTSNMTTSTFTVESPWVLDWRLNGDYETMLALDITLVDARSGIPSTRAMASNFLMKVAAISCG